MIVRSDGHGADPRRSESLDPDAWPVLIPSGQVRIFGTMLSAGGAGFHPTIILLHGFPGYEQNFDLGRAYRQAGFNVLLLRYRGAWGSPGNFCFSHAIEDVRSALKFVKNDGTEKFLQCDPDRVVLVGHSMGGFAAILTAATDRTVLGIASLAGFDFGRFAKILRDDDALRRRTIIDYEVNVAPLAGADPQNLVTELITHADEWDLTSKAADLLNTPLLLIAAGEDLVSPLDSHHKPLIDALRRAGAKRFEEHIILSDHMFSSARPELIRTTLNWLRRIAF